MIILSNGSSFRSRAVRARGLCKPLCIKTAAALALAAAVAVAAQQAFAEKPEQASKPGKQAIGPGSPKKMRLDHSGRSRVGLASYYAHRFSGRRMADGTPLKPESNNAASRTLPLGTLAQVVNLNDGKTAMVVIRDRGPYVRGRIIDLSPRTARQLGIVKAGVVRVEVTPMTIPQPDGTIKWAVAMSDPGKDTQRRAETP